MSKPVHERFFWRGSAACDSRRRPYSRVALDSKQRKLQLEISTRRAKPLPKNEEKHRRFDGKWVFSTGTKKRPK